MLVGGLSCTLLWMKPRNRRPGWVMKKLVSWRSSPTVHDCGRPVCWGMTTWVTLYAPSSNFPARTAPISFPSSVVLAAEDLKSSEMLLVINILVLSQLLGCPSSTFKEKMWIRLIETKVFSKQPSSKKIVFPNFDSHFLGEKYPDYFCSAWLIQLQHTHFARTNK